MKERTSVLSATGFALTIIFALVAGPLQATAAQSQSSSPNKASQLTSSAQPAPAAAEPLEGDAYFRDIYRNFYNSYKLGPGDQIAVRVQGQPDYSLEQITISPVGRIYHPLLGEIEVVDFTVPTLTERLTVSLSQYIIDPKVSVSLLAANSAKIGVLGDVTNPGVVLMSKPMTVLDAISASGGVSDSGSKSNVTVLRQTREGRLQKMKVNVKRILEGKAGPEENIALRAGDTIIVDGNTRKKISNITSMLGFGNFLWFIKGLY
jgi:polysaccharide export outer membrane protein